MPVKQTKLSAGEYVPRHIAIIMDGNGRWAKKRGLPRTAGHAVGSENFRKIALYCRDIGVDYLTVYAFSTENWKRPQDEVKTIMRLLNRYLHEAIDTMERDRMKMKVFGDVEGSAGTAGPGCRDQRDLKDAMRGFRRISASITADVPSLSRQRRDTQRPMPPGRSHSR